MLVSAPALQRTTFEHAARVTTSHANALGCRIQRRQSDQDCQQQGGGGEWGRLEPFLEPSPGQERLNADVDPEMVWYGPAP